ncbi:MAG: hypothetical protein JW896_15630 [Deltaproteobacteria bacterium]|nr:hypothetical protein [Deltaproteobacteria bacterium]
MKIEAYSFGWMIIDGKKYTSDLLIYPDGRVEDAWYRKRGHELSTDDISALIQAGPEIIIAGTGASGLMKPEKDLEKRLFQKGIGFISLPSHEAVKCYNQWSLEKPVGACFHLTC